MGDEDKQFDATPQKLKKSINDSFVPPTINLEEQDVEGGCDLDYTPNKGVEMNIDAAMSATFGFGGHNGAIIIKKFSE